MLYFFAFFFFFSSRRRHTRCSRDWSSDVCSSDLLCPTYSGRARGCGPRTGRPLGRQPRTAATRRGWRRVVSSSCGATSALGMPQWPASSRQVVARPEVRGRCRERHSRDTGLVKPALPLQDLLLGYGDGPAPPALVARERDVVARHRGRLALTIPQREEASGTRGVVRGVLPPRPPLGGRRPLSQCYEHTADQQNPPQVATHDSVLRANEVVRPNGRGHATPELSRLQMEVL